MRRPNVAASTIGGELRQAMESQGLTVKRLSEMTGKQAGHIEAVLDGYPNSKRRPTQLDTADDIAAALKLRLGLAPRT